MTWHCRWLQIKILGKIILHDPPFPNHCYPASWVMKSTPCVFHRWGATFINSSHLSSSHPLSCSVTTAALEAEGNCINQMRGEKRKENEVIFPVKDQGKRHHLLLQWQPLWGLLRDITLVYFWLHINAYVKIYGEIKATSSEKSMKDL